ncbi:MAG: hypothetical protein RLZZ519_1230 [Bacteroidota bacterium]|jgi:hypothetical protein
MNPPQFTPLPTILFLVITLFVFVAIVQGLVVGLRGIRHPNYTSVLYLAILGMFSWLGGLLLLSTNGFFANFTSMPPRVTVTIIVPFAVILFLTFKRSFGEFLDVLHPAFLIYLQTFRILVEVVLWLQFRDGNCPEQMTFEGSNFDIIAGITAPIVGWLAFGGGRENRILAIVWNFIGMGLLLNVVVTAILSIPQIGVFTPPNYMVAYWPMVWLPGFVAPFAMMLHLFSLRQLFRMK